MYQLESMSEPSSAEDTIEDVEKLPGGKHAQDIAEIGDNGSSSIESSPAVENQQHITNITLTDNQTTREDDNETKIIKLQNVITEQEQAIADKDKELQKCIAKIKSLEEETIKLKNSIDELKANNHTITASDMNDPTVYKGLAMAVGCIGAGMFTSESLGPVQVYCKRTDETATVIIDQLVDRLRKLKFECKMKNLDELSRNEKTIVVCFKATRILADVKEALPMSLEDIDIEQNWTGPLAMVVLNLSHSDTDIEYNITSTVLDGHEEYQIIRMVCDMTYINHGSKKKLCLDENAKGFFELKNFFKTCKI